MRKETDLSYYQTGAQACEPTDKAATDILIDHLRTQADRLAQTRLAMEELADRLFGIGPQSTNTTKPQGYPVGPGAVSEIMALIQSNAATLDEIVEQFRRLSRL